MDDLAPDFEHVFRGPHEHGVFRLLDLPPELWIKICAFAVTHAESIDISRARKNKDQQQRVKQPAITRVCRLLRLEALPLFYKHNDFEVFHLGKVACIRKWLVAIGATNLKSMGILLFHAKFYPSFWVEKFEEIGIPVQVEMGDGPLEEHPMSGFSPLRVKFL